MYMDRMWGITLVVAGESFYGDESANANSSASYLSFHFRVFLHCAVIAIREAQKPLQVAKEKEKD